MWEILLIEDDLEFSTLLCKMLRNKGYRVFPVTTGRDGIDFYAEHPTDLVITDVILPDRDGIHVILDIQKVQPNAKIIATSGGGCCASGVEYLDDIQLLCNIEHTLAKPFHRDDLFGLINQILHDEEVQPH